VYIVVMGKNIRLGERDPGKLIGEKEVYESRWPENWMYFVVIRKDIRLGGPRIDCAVW
jgi:hypothetical protein